MKTKVTKKNIMENYENVVCVSYCGLQSLLNYETPKYYTCGVYGWNADIYEVSPNTVIVTGYRPFGNLKFDYDKRCEAEKLSTNKSKEERAAILDELLLGIFND